jgi:tRNA nucleotidyltransferase (CCA-adding enzyme)
MPLKLEITLTEHEDRICNLLNECARGIHERDGITATCRIAGGWVRDKVTLSQVAFPSTFWTLDPCFQLLGLESHDIDIAVQDMMGLAFAERLVELARAKGVPASDPAVVKANPDQSKHLETTKVKVLECELDVVNLRSEEYASNSRIPTEVVSSLATCTSSHFSLG